MMKHVNPLYVLARGTRLHSLSHTVAKIHTRIQLQEGLFIIIYYIMLCCSPHVFIG